MSIGPWQILLILVIVLIIFGAGKLPRVAGDLAKGIKNFKKGMSDDSEAETADVNKSVEADKNTADTAVERDKAAQG